MFFLITLKTNAEKRKIELEIIALEVPQEFRSQEGGSIRGVTNKRIKRP